MKRIVWCCFLLLVLIISGCENLTSSMPTAPSSLPSGSRDSGNPTLKAKEAFGEVFTSPLAQGIPKEIGGVELMNIRGWLANLYPWQYVPEFSMVHPVARLWTPGQLPSPFQMEEQCRQIREYGGGAAVLEYNPNPEHRQYNYWLSTGFARGCGPFFILYEHINGTRFEPPVDGPIDMNLPNNRKVFKEDIDSIFRNVILRNQSRYVSVNGKAVIYLWNTASMTGDIVSLFEEVKSEYPVFFLGGESIPHNEEEKKRLMVIDGIMDYSLGGGKDNYANTVRNYSSSFFVWQKIARSLELKTGRKLLLIPTFQAAYDDSLLHRASISSVYPLGKEEVKNHARLIKSQMGLNFESVGPFVVYGELFEGAAVIESQCLPPRPGFPGTIDEPGRWVGCGTARLEILKECFSSFATSCSTR